jgi:short-subunit dehydrogenase
MSPLAGQVIVITGASEGIGRSLALELAPLRTKLVLAARNAARLEELASPCRALGSDVLVIPTDVTDPDACQHLIETAVQHFGGIDCLINNAGGTMWTLFQEIQDLSLFERLMRLNYHSAVQCTYFALPHLLKSRGRIVAVASVAGLSGVPTRTAYSAAKHAMFGFFDSLRIELAASGVSVTMVAPDFVVTEIHRRALDGQGNPLGTSPLDESKVMSAQQCARLIVPAVERRQRLLITSARGKLGRWLKLLAPALLDRLAARAILQKH